MPSPAGSRRSRPRRAAVTLRAPRGLGRLAPALRALVRATLAREGRRVGEVGILLAGDADLRALNRRWRGIDRATDVLSFAYDELGVDRGGQFGDALATRLARAGGRGSSRAARSAMPSLAPPRSSRRAPAPASARRESVARRPPPPGPRKPVGSIALSAGGAKRIPAIGARSGAISGDLVISLDRMADQARRHRVTSGRELARLAIHGVLHLAGLDHQRPAERRRMRLREDRVLAGAAAAVRTLDRLLAPARRR